MLNWDFSSPDHLRGRIVRDILPLSLLDEVMARLFVPLTLKSATSIPMISYH